MGDLTAELLAMAAEGLEVTFRPAAEGAVEIRVVGTLNGQLACLPLLVPKEALPRLLQNLRHARFQWADGATREAMKRGGTPPPHHIGSLAPLTQEPLRSFLLEGMRDQLRKMLRHSPFVDSAAEAFAFRLSEVSMALGAPQTPGELIRDAVGRSVLGSL